MPLLRRPTARPGFTPLRVAAIDPVADRAVSIAFDVSAPEHAAHLDYLAGQYLTLDATIDGERVRQSYSLWTRPARARAEGLVRVAVAEIAGGRMSPWLATKLAVGDTLAVLPPRGEFTYAAQPGPVRHGVIAGGSGITPVLAIMAEILAGDPEPTVDLVLANRSRASAVLRDEVAALADESAGRLTVTDVFSREKVAGQRFGRVDDALLDDVYGDPTEVDEWWICGPAGLLTLVEKWLADRGVPPERVHRERFTTTGPVDPLPERRTPAAETETESESESESES